MQSSKGNEETNMRILTSFLALSVIAGCSSSGNGTSGQQGAEDGLGVASMSIVKAPADGTCLQVTVVGSRIVKRSFDLVPDQTTIITVRGLPLGTDTFTELAFAGSCSAVTPSSIPTWASEPTIATLDPGSVAEVSIVLHRNGQANITSDFVDDAACVPLGDSCATNAECCTGTLCIAGACSTDTTPPVVCDPLTEVSFEGHCYYLDGSAGVCDPGYALASQTVLATIAPSFTGKDYKHTVSENCCVLNADADEDWGMGDHCNAAGPFTANDPSLGAIGCTDAVNAFPGQLTLCVSQ
jgi:hypothetical protein